MVNIYQIRRMLDERGIYQHQDVRDLCDEVENLRTVLMEYTDWQGLDVGIIPPITPGHGPCCTCQACGRHHDDCICEHNDICKILDPQQHKLPLTPQP
jgi:hypothetical protein